MTHQGATTVTISCSEILYALNQADKLVLTKVLVGDDDRIEGPYYLRDPFQTEPGWGVSSITFDLGALMERAESQ